MATSNNNILHPLFEIRQLVTEMQKYDLFSLTDEQVIQLRKDASKLNILAHTAVGQSLMAMSVSDRELLPECQIQLDIWCQRQGITEPQTLEFSGWINSYSTFPSGRKMPPTIRETLEWLREENAKAIID